MRRPGLALLATIACSMASTMGAVVAHGKESPPVDPANIALGHTVVFGSIEVRWPDQPAMVRLGNSAEKIVQVQSLEKVKQQRASIYDPAAVIRPRVGEEKTFVLDLLAGDYVLTCLYHKNLLGSQPDGYCYPLDVAFTAAAGQVTYIGKIVARMPAKMLSLTVGIDVVDDRAAAEERLAAKYGPALSAAATRLADSGRSPARLPGIAMTAFPRLAAAMDQPERSSVDFDPRIGAFMARFVVEGSSLEQWTMVVDTFETPRSVNPPTVDEWWQGFRASGDSECPSEWTVLAQSPDSVTFERRAPQCGSLGPEQSIYRTLYGPDAVYMVVCTQKVAFDEQNRRDCLSLVESARVEK